MNPTTDESRSEPSARLNQFSIDFILCLRKSSFFFLTPAAAARQYLILRLHQVLKLARRNEITKTKCKLLLPERRKRRSIEFLFRLAHIWAFENFLPGEVFESQKSNVHHKFFYDSNGNKFEKKVGGCIFFLYSRKYGEKADSSIARGAITPFFTDSCR